MKTQKTPSPPQQPGRSDSGPAALTRALGVAAVCTLAAGCPGTGPQVLPTPAAEPCPPGAVEAMQKLGINLGAEGHAAFFVRPSAQVMAVREGPVTVTQLGPFGSLPGHDTQLLGRVILGEDRAYARFTQARTLDGSINVPVCLEAWDQEGGRGVKRRGEQPTDAASAGVGVYFELRAVGEFE